MRLDADALAASRCVRVSIPAALLLDLTALYCAGSAALNAYRAYSDQARACAAPAAAHRGRSSRRRAQTPPPFLCLVFCAGGRPRGAGPERRADEAAGHHAAAGQRRPAAARRCRQRAAETGGALSSFVKALRPKLNGATHARTRRATRSSRPRPGRRPARAATSEQRRRSPPRPPRRLRRSPAADCLASRPLPPAWRRRGCVLPPSGACVALDVLHA